MSGFPETAGHLKPSKPPEQWTKPRVAVVTTDGPRASCSCGWLAQHYRDKVREDKIDAHLNKRHGGSGIRV